ncbi:MAG: hypothetical protein ABEJ75_03280 [Candidatus Nanohaloarchaea archaeon]
MTFLGLELNAGLTAAMALSIVAVFWNYSSLPEINWSTIAAGVMSMLAGAGVNVLNGSTALGAFAAVPSIAYIAALLYIAGGLLVLIGAVVQGLQLLNDRWA